MHGAGDQMPFRRVWILGGLIAAFASLLIAASAAAATEIHTPGFPLARGTRASSITLGPDGNMWFAGDKYQVGEGPLGEIGRVTSGGQVTEFEIPTQKSGGGPRESEYESERESSRAWTVTDGPDGNLWFAGESGRMNEIGRITPSGSLTQFALPDPNSAATTITAGPDGNLWFTEDATSKIGRITPSGAITEFPLSPEAGPHGITAGPDGALWFAESGTNRIGRIDPSGVITEFPLSSPTSRPNEITLGPDGNLWFTETVAPKIRSYSPSLANQIGRITPSGQVTMFPVEARWPGTGAITAGPDGRIWFATGTGALFPEYGSSPTPEIGWITPSGQTAPPACVVICGYPANSLAVGPGGALWFGLGTPYNSGGGGSGLIQLGEPGYVGTYSPPPLTLGIGIPPVRKGRTAIKVDCEGTRSCEGELSVSAYYGSKPPTVGHGRYALASGKSAIVPLRLNRTGMRLLKKEKHLRVNVVARSSQGRFGQGRAVELRRQTKARGSAH
jgi:streptogramin lyase